MKRVTFLASASALAIGVVAGALLAQQAPAPRPFFVGNRLGLPVNPAADGAFEAMSSNVKVFGSIYSAESCSYDAGRGLIVVPSRGVPQNVQTNNAVGVVPQPRRLRPHRALARRADAGRALPR
jgi:hypothetical protein